MFIRGKEYRRTELHTEFAGQRQGGISTPKDHPLIFIFTGVSGKKHGYDDYWEDDIFNFFGEGQTEDMQMWKGNRALRDHRADGKTVHLFRIARKGVVGYEGEATYLGHHREPSRDRHGDAREAIVFELALDSYTPEGSSIPDLRSKQEPARSAMWKMELAQLRANASSEPTSSDETKTRVQEVRARSQAVKIYARRRADGVCEGCDSPAPFMDRRGRPFLEVHHIYRLADDGPDDPDSVIALCPNCHRRVHSGGDGDEFNRKLVGRMSERLD